MAWELCFIQFSSFPIPVPHPDHPPSLVKTNSDHLFFSSDETSRDRWIWFQTRQRREGKNTHLKKYVQAVRGIPTRPFHYGTKPGHFETSKIRFPTSQGVSKVSKRANEWAQRRARAKRIVRSNGMSERCERTGEWTSEWPSTSVCIFGCSGPQCIDRCACLSLPSSHNFDNSWGVLCNCIYNESSSMVKKTHRYRCLWEKKLSDRVHTMAPFSWNAIVVWFLLSKSLSYAVCHLLSFAVCRMLCVQYRRTSWFHK